MERRAGVDSRLLGCGVCYKACLPPATQPVAPNLQPTGRGCRSIKTITPICQPCPIERP